MRFNCGLSWEEKERKQRAHLINWHPWFAWYPIRTAPNECRWLESVWRKGTVSGGYDGFYWEWEYTDRV